VTPTRGFSAAVPPGRWGHPPAPTAFRADPTPPGSPSTHAGVCQLPLRFSAGPVLHPTALPNAGGVNASFPGDEHDVLVYKRQEENLNSLNPSRKPFRKVACVGSKVPLASAVQTK